MPGKKFIRVKLVDEETGEELGTLSTRTSVSPEHLLDDFGQIMHEELPMWAKFHNLPVCERNDLRAMGVTDPRRRPSPEHAR